MRELEIPSPSLVLIWGCEGSGAGAFAERLFGARALRARTFRRAVSGEADAPRWAGPFAASVLATVAERRARGASGLPLAVEFEPWEGHDPTAFSTIARRAGLPCRVLALSVPARRCRARRPDLSVEETSAQRKRFDQALGELRKRKGVSVEVLAHPDQITGWRGRPLACDRRDERGPFDLIGDVHGCYEELVLLLGQLGYTRDDAGGYQHPEGRRLVFLGDFTDRGPRNLDALRLVMRAVAGGALAVRGNHDDKLRRYLAGRKVSISHGLQVTVDELEALPEGEALPFRTAVEDFLADLPSHLVLDGGDLVAVHGGLEERLIGREGGRVDSFALYGDPSGKLDADGYPERRDWAQAYRGPAWIAYGHTPIGHAAWRHRTICIDQGCVFGGALSALRWPERTTLCVPAQSSHSPPRGSFRPLLLAPLAGAPAPDWP
ncbi:MAG: metallophosphoesterase [Planctomycetes bacterium]|nr:metallophosphoesterase [Planctomycetota bacterium]